MSRALGKSRAQGPTLTIFMYHGLVEAPLAVPDWCLIAADRFERHLVHLRRHFRIRPLGEALADLRAGTLDRDTAAVTFDDGLASVHDLALPLLEKHEAPATIFLATGFVDAPGSLWWCDLVQALNTTTADSVRWRDTTHPVPTPSARRRFLTGVQFALKRLPHDEMLREVEDLVDQLLPGARPPSAFPTLSAGQVAELASHRLIDFGAHTCDHTILTKVPSQLAKAQIESSIVRTEELTGRECRLFSYPNGGPDDIDDAVVAMVASTGVDAAVTTISGTNDASSDPMRLRRVGVGGLDSVLAVWLRSSSRPIARRVVRGARTWAHS